MKITDAMWASNFDVTKIEIDMSHPSMKMLTHLPLDKMASISQAIISNAFDEWKTSYFGYNFTEVCS